MVKTCIGMSRLKNTDDKDLKEHIVSVLIMYIKDHNSLEYVPRCLYKQLHFKWSVAKLNILFMSISERVNQKIILNFEHYPHSV